MLEPAVLDDLRAAAHASAGPRPASGASVTAAAFTPITVAGATWPDGIARYQLERLGYFCVDPDTSLTGAAPRLVLHRTVTLKDDWAKAAGS